MVLSLESLELELWRFLADRLYWWRPPPEVACGSGDPQDSRPGGRRYQFTNGSYSICRVGEALGAPEGAFQGDYCFLGDWHLGGGGF